jgi:nucleotide-binding universal stress UspA family protein/hemerythrin-like domain-containing protein
MYRHLLVPVDDTEISAGNVTAAVDFARDAGARITFFHANPDYAATGDGALMRAMSPAMFTDRAAGHARAILAKAEAAARAAGIACRGISTVSDRPAQAILDTAETEGCDLIFMASRGPTSLGGIMLGSQTLKVLVAATIPVLVSSVAHKARHGARDAAVATIKDEHRSIAALLHALSTVVGKSAQGSTIDTKLVRAAVHYLHAFPETLHHPKEEQYIFKRLRDRSPDLDRVLDELERQHAEGGKLLGAVVDAVDAYDRQPGSPAVVHEAWDAFTTEQRRHMQTEEQTVLPAAQEVLTDDDWSDIADAFRGNGDPRFDRLVDSDFRELFARIMNLAAPPDDSVMADHARASVTPSPDPLARDRLPGNAWSPTDAA